MRRKPNRLLGLPLKAFVAFAVIAATFLNPFERTVSAIRFIDPVLIEGRYDAALPALYSRILGDTADGKDSIPRCGGCRCSGGFHCGFWRRRLGWRWGSWRRFGRLGATLGLPEIIPFHTVQGSSLFGRFVLCAAFLHREGARAGAPCRARAIISAPTHTAMYRIVIIKFLVLPGHFSGRAIKNYSNFSCAFVRHLGCFPRAHSFQRRPMSGNGMACRAPAPPAIEAGNCGRPALQVLSRFALRHAAALRAGGRAFRGADAPDMRTGQRFLCWCGTMGRGNLPARRRAIPSLGEILSDATRLNLLARSEFAPSPTKVKRARASVRWLVDFKCPNAETTRFSAIGTGVPKGKA